MACRSSDDFAPASAREQIGKGAAAIVEVVAVLLQLAQDRIGRHRVLVAQQHDIVAIGFHLFATRRHDHDRRIEPILFLAAGVAVIPIGARLPDLEAIG